MAKQIDDIVSFDPAECYEFTDNEVRRQLLPPPGDAGPDNDHSKVVGDIARVLDRQRRRPARSRST